jgi:putative Holliday junction resolvase
MQAMPEKGVLAFDFGEKRIGVAVGDTAVGIAHPLATIRETSNERRFAAIERLVSEWRPGRLVVGLPFHMDGTEHELTRLARKFAQRLHARFKLPIVFEDERLSSAIAESRLAEGGVKRDERKRLIDEAAAREILQSHFDSGRGHSPDKV